MYFYWYYYLLSFLLLPGLILSIIAQIKTTTSFEKNNKKQIRSGKTAGELAQEILRYENLSHIKIQRCHGHLTDHYNPKSQTVSLSDSVYNNSSISAVGVMAHELGHVLQYRDGYGPIKIRAFLVPIINFSNILMWPITFLGLFLEVLAYAQVGYILILIGIGIFALSTLFALVTVPVERNASKRAYKLLLDAGIIDKEEGKSIKEVLNAAGMTYIAALITSILSLLRFVLFIFSIRNRD